MPNLEGLKMSQIAVLAPGRTEKIWQDFFGTIPVTMSFEELGNNEGVLVASSGRFKGLEADAIVIIETSRHDDAKNTCRHLRGAVAVETPACCDWNRRAKGYGALKQIALYESVNHQSAANPLSRLG